MPYILERQVPNHQQPRDTQGLSSIPRPIKKLNLNNNGGISHASKPTTEKLPQATPSKAHLKSRAIVQDEQARSRIVPLDSDPELAILELIPFGQQPVVNFGQILLGSTRIKYITFRNPLDKQQQLFVSSFPKTDKGFNMEATEFLIAPKTEICVALACTPKTVGGFRETITVQDMHRMSKKIILLGSVMRPKKEPILIKSCNRGTRHRIYNNTPSKSCRQQGLERNNRLFSPRVSTFKPRRDAKPLIKLQFPSPQKRHQIVRAVIARRDLPIKQKAAVIIQSHARALIARREFLKIRNAIIFLQKRIRGFLARREYLARNEAVIKIQKNFKSLCARRKFIALRTAAIVLQSHFRKVIARRKFLGLRTATICLQKYQRGQIARQDFLSIRKATICLQAHTRGLLARREFHKVQTATICLQKYYRGSIERQKFRRIRSATICLQSHVRGLLTRKSFQRTQAAASCLQRHYRGLVARREFRRTRTAAICMQRHYKGLIARREFERIRAATVRLQAQTRKLIARNKFLRIQKATICLQKYYRGLVARREKARLQRLLLATTWMQSRIRGYLCRIRLQRSIQAIQSIQQKALNG